MTRRGMGRNTRSERVTKTMKTRKTSHMNEENEGTPIGDTKTQFRWLPEESVGNTAGGTSESRVEETGLELERLKRRLEAMEEKEDDMREQNRRDTTKVRMKPVNVPTLNSMGLEENRRWKRSLRWWSECTQFPLEMQAPRVIMNWITNAELNEMVITMDRDKAQ